MALGPITPAAPQPAQPAPARDIRALREAFFQAALNGVEKLAQAPPQPAPPAAAAPAVEPEPTNSEPRRGYRPGLLLDIKV
jgi:hypothetical protein